MREKDILYNSILKAEKNGYTEHLVHLPILTRDTYNADELAKSIFFAHKREIIFSHAFAKAFFGNDDVVYSVNAWARRLEEMSKEDNEIKFLERFL